MVLKPFKKYYIVEIKGKSNKMDGQTQTMIENDVDSILDSMCQAIEDNFTGHESVEVSVGKFNCETVHEAEWKKRLSNLDMQKLERR